jgi:hypothetical protein
MLPAMPLPRLCIRCGRRTQTSFRLVGEPDFLAAELRALGASERVARTAAGATGKRSLNVALCRSCARPRGVAVGSNPAPAVEQPESVIRSGA